MKKSSKKMEKSKKSRREQKRARKKEKKGRLVADCTGLYSNKPFQMQGSSI